MTSQYLDLVKFYSHRNIVHCFRRDDCRGDAEAVRRMYAWLTGDQGLKITRVSRELTSVAVVDGVALLPDGSRMTENGVTVY